LEGTNLQWGFGHRNHFNDSKCLLETLEQELSAVELVEEALILNVLET
jgi:hypothetical protein